GLGRGWPLRALRELYFLDRHHLASAELCALPASRRTGRRARTALHPGVTPAGVVGPTLGRYLHTVGSPHEPQRRPRPNRRRVAPAPATDADAVSSLLTEDYAMRGNLPAVVVLVVCLVSTAGVRAGLYNTDTKEPPPGPNMTRDGVEALPFTLFRQD